MTRPDFSALARPSMVRNSASTALQSTAPVKPTNPAAPVSTSGAPAAAVGSSSRRSRKASQPKRARQARGPKESAIQKAILKAFELRPWIFAERQNSGAMGGTHKGKRRYVRFSRPGAPDIRVCVSGRYAAIEVKRPGEKQNDNQIAWQADFERRGGVYRVVRSVAEALAVVEAVNELEISKIDLLNAHRSATDAMLPDVRESWAKEAARLRDHVATLTKLLATADAKALAEWDAARAGGVK